MKIVNYCVVDAEGVSLLNSLVDQYLMQGWELHGSVFAMHVNPGNNYLAEYRQYLQTMVKYEDKTANEKIPEKPEGFFSKLDDDSIASTPCIPGRTDHDLYQITRNEYKCAFCYCLIDKTRNNE